MAAAYSASGSSVRNNAELRKDMNSALEWTYSNWYNETTNGQKAWWNVHGLPPIGVDIGVYFYDGFDSGTKTKWARGVRDNLEVNVFKTSGSADNMNKAKSQIGFGLFSGETALIDSSVKIFSDGLKFIPGKSYKTDGTYEYHNAFYNGGYGVSDIEAIADMTALVAGSSSDITTAQQDFLFGRIFETFEPVMFEGRLMEFSRGREVTRGGTVGKSANLLNALLIISENAPGSYKPRLESLLKSWMLADANNLPSGLSGYAKILATRILGNGNIKPQGTKNRLVVFGQGDAVSYFGNDFAATIKMHSQRNASFETNNGENIKGWYQSEGVVQLYTAGSPHLPPEYWVTIDSQRLPGTTVSTQSLKPVTKFIEKSGLNMVVDWAGGSSVGDKGAVGQQINPTQLSQLFPPNIVDVQAKKSWFIFDNSIVALGADINSNDAANAVETIIDNRIVKSGDTYAINGQNQSSANGTTSTTNNVKWSHVGDGSGPGVGYYFPAGHTVNSIRNSRSGTRNEITGLGGGAAVETSTWLTTYLSHGIKPNQQTYSYVMLPNRTKAQTQDYAVAPTVNVLSNSGDVQAVESTDGTYVGANFWAQKSVVVQSKLGDVSSKNKASMTLLKMENKVSFAVSDPTQLQQTVRVCFGQAATLAGSYSGVSVVSSNPLVLDISTAGKLGASVNAEFELASTNKSCGASSNTGSENTPTPAPTPTPTPTPPAPTVKAGDIARGDGTKGNDGKVDVNDLNYLVGKWNQTSSTDGGADLNKDGTVDIKDIVELLLLWE